MKMTCDEEISCVAPHVQGESELLVAGWSTKRNDDILNDKTGSGLFHISSFMTFWQIARPADLSSINADRKNYDLLIC